MPTIARNARQGGFSLIEAVFALFVLSLLALAVTKALLFAKYTAEDNLYEATSLAVAVSAVEQIKGASIEELRSPQVVDGNPVFRMSVEGSSTTPLTLDQPNEIEVPLVTGSSGEVGKRLPLRITPSITPMNNNNGYWITVRYAYEHPRSGAERSRVVRNARTVIPSF